MDRERFTEKLVRMIETIRSGKLSAQVRELYVFGSYARGALEPGDLDVVVVHDGPGPAYFEAIAHNLDAMMRASRLFESELRGALRKKGEKVEIILVRKVEEILGSTSKIKREDLVLLWSESDDDYRPKLEAIWLDPDAGRAPRDHIVSLKRLSDSITTMEETVGMLQTEEIVLTRLSIESIDCRLNAFHAHWCEYWTKIKIMGKDSIRLLPYAMWWLEQHGEETICPERLELWSASGTHRVDLGRPSLGSMLYVFKMYPAAKRQCLIPHIKPKQSNELLVFERGRSWTQSDDKNGNLTMDCVPLSPPPVGGAKA